MNEKNVLIVRGSIPGGTNALLVVRDSLKGKKKDQGSKQENVPGSFVGHHL